MGLGLEGEDILALRHGLGLGLSAWIRVLACCILLISSGFDRVSGGRVAWSKLATASGSGLGLEGLGVWLEGFRVQN